MEYELVDGGGAVRGDGLLARMPARVSQQSGCGVQWSRRRRWILALGLVAVVGGAGCVAGYAVAVSGRRAPVVKAAPTISFASSCTLPRAWVSNASATCRDGFPFVAFLTLSTSIDAFANVTWVRPGRQALWGGSEVHCEAGSATSFALSRLTHGATYRVGVTLRDAQGRTASGACDVRTASLPPGPTGGVPPKARVAQGAPSYQVLYAPGDHAPSFFDAHGDLVWHADLGFAGTGTLAGLGYNVDRAGPRTLVFASVNAEFAPKAVDALSGTVLSEFDASRDCDRTSGTFLTHDIRVDALDPEWMLGIRVYAAAFDDLERPQVAAKVVRWRWNDTDAIDVVGDLAHWLDPVTQRGWMSGREWLDVKCPDDAKSDRLPQDWLHTNAISAGAHANYIISMKHTSAVLSVDASTRQKSWVLSSEIDSDYVLDDPFTNQHAASQLPNGNIVLYDNGVYTNGPHATGYSRAVEYELGNGTATKVWEFNPKHVPQTGYGGWVQDIGHDGRRRLVSFNQGFNGKRCGDSRTCTAKVFEVDAAPSFHPKILATLEVEWVNDAFYRAVAFDSIAGEVPWHGEVPDAQHDS